ncbi:MAG: hypothetical protein ABI600_07485 [Luteolibacter sp.]
MDFNRVDRQKDARNQEERMDYTDQQGSSIKENSPLKPQPLKTISPPRRQGREVLKAGASLIGNCFSELGALGVLAVQNSSNGGNFIQHRSLVERPCTDQAEFAPAFFEFE